MKPIFGIALIAASTAAISAPPSKPAAFAVCAACHSTEAGQPNRMGPNLHGIVGRQAGAVPGFVYSAAMKKAGAWTPEKLRAFLEAPQQAVPGTRMPYGGEKDPKALAAILDYLKTLK